MFMSFAAVVVIWISLIESIRKWKVRYKACERNKFFLFENSDLILVRVYFINLDGAI